MKYFLRALFFIAFAVVSGCALFGPVLRTERQVISGDGIYEGTGRGYRGPIRVEVLIEGGSIWAIGILSSNEDPAVGGIAIEELLDLVLEYGTTDLDAVSGATESSKGFLEAVENAIIKP